MLLTAYAPSAEACADAITEPTHFVLYLNDGEKVAFVLEHNPKVVHGDGAITVVDNEITIEYALDDIHKYLLEVPTATGMDNAADDAACGNIGSNAGDIILSGFDGGTPITVTDMGGRLIYGGSTDDSGYMVVHMAQYPAGVYIIKAGNKLFKFIKR